MVGYFDEEDTEQPYHSGCINTSGESVVPFDFDMVRHKPGTTTFFGRIYGSYPNEWREFDVESDDEAEAGKLITMETSEMDFECHDYSEGPAHVNQSGEAADSVRYVNESGEDVIVLDEEYCQGIVGVFEDKMCPVFKPYKGNGYEGYVYAFMDENGEISTDFSYFYDDYNNPLFTGGFHNGFALVRTLPDRAGMVHYGYIDKKGNWAIEKTYEKKYDRNNDEE